jgi:hypothetical protein
MHGLEAGASETMLNLRTYLVLPCEPYFNNAAS